MKKNRYSWTRGYSVPAQTVGEIVEKLPQRTAESLLKEASKSSSPLHGQFEWNDSLAAQQYRLVQARVMIASLRVEVVDVDQKVEHVMAFVRTADRSGHYVPSLEADDDDLGEAELRCWQQMKAFRERWKGLQFARAVVQAIEAVDRVASKRKPSRKAG